MRSLNDLMYLCARLTCAVAGVWHGLAFMDLPFTLNRAWRLIGLFGSASRHVIVCSILAQCTSMSLCAPCSAAMAV